ncbi:MAG TPA: TylF/MycF/NovP-related O-methyltransferase, partial [Candidatus Binatia bacterium]
TGWTSLSVLKVSLEEVKSNFLKFGLSSNVEFVNGYFRDSLAALTGPLSILRLDVDSPRNYEDCMRLLYPKVSVGGLVIFDEWSCEADANAVRKYLGFEPAITMIDRVSGWMQKP